MIAVTFVALLAAGCGSDLEADWEAELSQQVLTDLEAQEPRELAALCIAINGVTDDELEKELGGTIGDEYTGSGRPLTEMLESYGLEYNTARIQRAVTLAVASIRDACD